MPGVRRVTPLAIIVADASGPRLLTALTLACAAAALGREVRMLFDGGSVAALAATRDDELRTAALDLGVRVTACQTGLADLGLAATDLAPGIDTGGMVAFVALAGDAQIVLG